MKRIILLILVLLLMVDIAEDGFLGRVNFYLPHPSAKTSITFSVHPHTGQTDFGHELAFLDLPGRPWYGSTQPVTLQVPPTLQIIHCCHLSSSGGIPLERTFPS
jgi:hypothetical protein